MNHPIYLKIKDCISDNILSGLILTVLSGLIIASIIGMWVMSTNIKAQEIANKRLTGNFEKVANSIKDNTKTINEHKEKDNENYYSIKGMIKTFRIEVLKELEFLGRKGHKK